MHVASNSAPRAVTASTANTEESKMDVKRSAPAAQPNTSPNAGADNGDIESLSNDLRRVSTLETQGQALSSSELAAERYLSREWERIAKSKVGISPGSNNLFNGLGRPPTLKEAQAYGEKLMVELQQRKRSRLPSSDSPSLNQNARSESEDVEMNHTAPQAFHFSRDCRSKEQQPVLHQGRPSSLVWHNPR